MAEIGIITEQGDLGFGFNKLNKNDSRVYHESENNNRNIQYDNKYNAGNKNDNKK